MRTKKWSLLARTSLISAGVLFAATALAADDANTGGGSVPPLQDYNAGASAMPTQSDQTQNGSAQQPRQVEGRISAINLAKETITVKGMLLGKTIHLGSDAQIAIEGKSPATLSDLKVGDRVEVRYHRDGDSLAADQITRLGSKESSSGSSSTTQTPAPATTY